VIIPSIQQQFVGTETEIAQHVFKVAVSIVLA